jgi:hypothetical protein
MCHEKFLCSYDGGYGDIYSPVYDVAFVFIDEDDYDDTDEYDDEYEEEDCELLYFDA